MSDLYEQAQRKVDEWARGKDDFHKVPEIRAEMGKLFLAANLHKHQTGEGHVFIRPDGEAEFDELYHAARLASEKTRDRAISDRRAEKPGQTVRRALQELKNRGAR